MEQECLGTKNEKQRMIMFFHRRLNSCYVARLRRMALVLGLLAAALSFGHEDSLRDSEVVHVPSFDLPGSRFVDPESKHSMLLEKNRAGICPVRGSPDTIVADRSCLNRHYYGPMARKLNKEYRVLIERGATGGVTTDVITPADGISKKNENRVLINLHGGAFLYGDQLGGQIESIPVASVAKIKIISVEYRLAPEHTFPAARDDAVAVYKALLKTNRPENIGIFGCSAGAILTAQTLAQLQNSGLPLPGAVGMFGGGAYAFGGDSHHIAYALLGQPVRLNGRSSMDQANDLYANGVASDDPRFSPGISPVVMARFPASLLISSTRDVGLSTAAMTHSQLVKLGVPADLHVWEGVDHCFLYNPDLAASREAYEVISRFFDRHLGVDRAIQ